MLPCPGPVGQIFVKVKSAIDIDDDEFPSFLHLLASFLLTRFATHNPLKVMYVFRFQMFFQSKYVL